MPMMWILAFFVTFVIGGLTGVMVAVVPFDWQVHDTHLVVAHLHYVLVGGFVFPMLAALYYWMPQMTGRKRFFKLGETAFWLIAVGFHVTFLAVHWVGLLGMRRRIDTYDSGQGWEAINLISSIGGFVMAIGFAMVLVDVVVNAAVAVRGSRDPWRAGTLEWAMPPPPPSYNFTSIPQINARDPLYDDPDLPVRIARGEGYLGDPSRNRRETLTVRIASGEPDYLVIYPTNTPLPIIMSFVTGGIFLGMLLKLYWLVPLAALGVAALIVRWVWSLGRVRDEGQVDVGRGTSLHPAAEVPDPPGWWGSLFLLLADATLFGSLLFGFAFLWTVAPDWPPPDMLRPDLLGAVLAVAGAALAPIGIRLSETRLRGGHGIWLGLLVAAIGLAALAVAAGLIFLRTQPPDTHAYDATLWVVAGYLLFHVVLAGGMTAFLAARMARGYLSPRRIGEVRITRLWVDYAAVTSLLGLGAVYLPGLLP